MKLCFKGLAILALLLLVGMSTQAEAQTYSFSGTVKNSAGQGVDGATISLVGSPGTSTTSDGTGAFTLSGIPSGQPISVKMSKDTFLDSYTSNMSLTQNATSANPFTLFTSADVAQWSITPGKGVITGRIAEQGNDANLIAGAVVSAASGQHPGTPYVVVYPADSGPPGTQFTGTNGKYMVVNVDDGDTVTVTATKTGWTFGQRVFVTHAAGISQGRVYGTASGGGSISASGTVQSLDATPVPLSGVTVEKVGNSAINATTDMSGSFTVTGLPSGQDFHLKMMKTGYNFVPSYTRILNDTQNITMSRPYSLFTSEAMASLGSAPGKGVIKGAVVDQADPLNTYIGGAAVSYVSSQGRTYRVTYTGGGQATASDGRFSILDIEADDIIMVSVAKAGWTFPTRSFYGHTDGVTQGVIPGTGSGGGTISASGMVQTTGATPVPLSGVTVEQAGNPSITATSDASGNFAVTGLPSGQNFHLKMTKTGYVPTYTKVFNSAQNITMARPYVMYTEEEAGAMQAAFQVPFDTSVIAGRVVDQSNPLSTFITGAVVSYISAFGRTSYRVAYEGGGNSTGADGKFYILDVEEGDTVQVTATKTGWTFPTVTFATHSDGLMMGAIGGTGSGGGGGDPDTLSLEAGWTMFSIPKQPPDTAIATVLSSLLSDVVVVYAFDNEAKVWKRYVPGAGDNTLTTLEQGKGYWIYLRNAGSIDMSSWGAGSTTVHLYEGWNLVGYSGTSALVETSLANITGWVVSWTWCEDAWHLKHATLSDLPVMPFLMFNQQKGYWVFMEQGASGDWSQ